MLFSRGQWAVFGVESESQVAFDKAMSDPIIAFKTSQVAASINTKFHSTDSSGVNPFINPRLDETFKDESLITKVNALLSTDSVTPDTLVEVSGILSPYFGTTEDFALGNNKYGFWMVFNEFEDPTDPASKKEALAYEDMERPFKFLIKDEKKSIEERVTATAILNRSQFPVILDFQHGRVYVASSNVDDVNTVNEFLTNIGVKTFAMAWDFEYSSWPGEFLNRIAEQTRFKDEMKTRADELSRFRADEVEALEDKAMEKIVSNFFAITELETELWVALSTPARVRIHKPIDPVGVSNPSVAFSLLNMSKDAEVASAAVVFQEVIIKNTKNGEKLYRNDLFTIDINDNVNLSDAGAAMLRGFDLPQFKKEVKATLKAKGTISIKDFWYMWLDGMHNAIMQFVDNMTDVLEIDKTVYGLVKQDFSGSKDEIEVIEE